MDLHQFILSINAAKGDVFDDESFFMVEDLRD